MNHSLKNSWNWLYGIVFLALLVVGCSPENFPTGSAPPVADSMVESEVTPGGGVSFSLSQLSLAKRTTDNASKIKKKRIGPKGGRISIKHSNTDVNFSVPRGALKSPVKISMQVLGGGPASIVHFEPHGLHFLKPARLRITFPSEGVNIRALGGYLLSETEGPTPVPHKIVIGDGEITVIIMVPHFSEYSPGDGDEDYSDEDYFEDDYEDDGSDGG